MKKKKILKIVAAVMVILVAVLSIVFMVQKNRWDSMSLMERFDSIMERTVSNRHVYGVIAAVETADGQRLYQSAKGEAAVDDRFAAASITKMFTAALIFQLAEENIIQMSDTLDLYLTSEELRGLHLYEGQDLAGTITIQQLVSQTSGLPDYFTEEVDGQTLFDEIVQKDKGTDFFELLERTKSLRPHFASGSPGKAFYSDINFDILGVIAESVTNQTLEDLYRERITDPLGLVNTALATVDDEYAPIYFKQETLDIPLAMAGFRASGGMITDLDDLMIFLRAFMEGGLFPADYIMGGQWNPIQFEFHDYKNGMMRFEVTGLWALMGSYEVIGHSGSSGSFAFYCPQKEIYVAGTLNQVTDPSIMYRMMIQLADSVDS